MGLLAKLSRNNNKNKELSNRPSEIDKIIELQLFLRQLLEIDDYIARSAYLNTIDDYRDIVNFFEVLIKSSTLENYCVNYRINSKGIKETIKGFQLIENLVDKHNDDYIKNHLVSDKEYLDNILKDIDENILLDEDQRRVILSDEDYTLVVAGAGAGKTTTIAAKVKYLVDYKKINPKNILVISFTNKAVKELRDRINKGLNIDCPIATFHSTGNVIIKKNDLSKLNIVEDGKLYLIIQDYLKNSILKNESMVNNLILFFASYFDAPYQGNDLNEFFNDIAKSNFSTIRSDINDYEEKIIDSRMKKSISINSEIMRSRQEVEIANYLYINGIDYQYEPIYKYDISFSRKPYTPDFLIKQNGKELYIEHFGINQDGTSKLYNDKQLQIYKKAINDKIQFHKQHGTDLIFTFSRYNDNRSVIEHLNELLLEKGFSLNPRSKKEILEKIISTQENRYIRKLVALVCRFISNFKVNNFDINDFEKMFNSTSNVRNKLFLDICKECYLEYERYLKENNAVDFSDMINKSTSILNNVKEVKEKLEFDYIIVDEYQDISRQRFDLVKALNDVTNAKIMAVGDDWQSIFAFSGADITLFTKFSEKMGYAKLLKIERTYRNSQEIIDIAGSFIQKNETQIKKSLISNKTISDPIIIYSYDGTYKKDIGKEKTGAIYSMAKAVEAALDQINEYNKIEKRNSKSILLLGRYGFDGYNLTTSELFEFKNNGTEVSSLKYPDMKLTFLTVHASKGLGYDEVIILNGKNGTFGFPSKIENDPVLSFVVKKDSSYDYAEERRLFYVALTRTKNRVYVVAPEQYPSEFLLELRHEYKNVVLKGNLIDNIDAKKKYKRSCPLCGFPLQYKYKNSYGLRLYICTNEPEVCGFMTNDIEGGKLSILKCDKCRDGYLIVKPTKNMHYFLGCTNYKDDNTGCNNKIWDSQYFYQKTISNEENFVNRNDEK